MANGNPSEEYKDLSENMRHYANMRFAQLTLYFALTAGLVTALFTVDPPLGDNLRLALKIIGVLASAAFGVMEERAADYWHHFRRRAVEIEKSLAYKQYTDRPGNKLFSATNAARLMVWGGVPLWLLAVIFRM
ncbi:MAG TPA: hypothetical protein VMW24_23110 [Sedimentisphaerales bacterium]|nr:hypothetical protein [Sedimentisphaerales bacterium]